MKSPNKQKRNESHFWGTNVLNDALGWRHGAQGGGSEPAVLPRAGGRSGLGDAVSHDGRRSSYHVAHPVLPAGCGMLGQTGVLVLGGVRDWGSVGVLGLAVHLDL